MASSHSESIRWALHKLLKISSFHDNHIGQNETKMKEKAYQNPVVGSQTAGPPSSS
jgi:hypothetical protein